MASSRKSRPSSCAADALSAHVIHRIQGEVGRGDSVALGLSGGLDSVVLLDLLASIAPQLGFELSAVHVNHQISPNAAAWQLFCRALCRRRAIGLQCFPVEVARGDSLEAAARSARYRVFAQLPVSVIALAQHQDDQAETVLLQLLRGAGLRGLSAMPAARSLGQPTGAASAVAARLVRPLLDVPRSQLKAYARQRRLRWIEDESNADVSLDRNFLRHQVLPIVEQHFPAYRTTLGRAGRNMAEAAQLLDSLAAKDARGALTRAGLRIAALRRLDRARAKNLLRYFLAVHSVTMPAAVRLEECLRQALQSADDAEVRILLAGCELRRFGDTLHIVEPLPVAHANFERIWQGEDTMPIEELGGTLLMRRRRGAGIDVERLAGQTVSVRPRRGGERLRPDCARPRRTLKNLLQEIRLPPWARERLPLLFAGEDLVWVPGIGIDCAYQAHGRQPALMPHWRAGAQTAGRA